MSAAMPAHSYGRTSVSAHPQHVRRDAHPFVRADQHVRPSRFHGADTLVGPYTMIDCSPAPCLPRRPFDDRDLVVRQIVQRVHQPVGLVVGRRDLPLDHRALVAERGGFALVQVEHALHQRDHAIVAGVVGGVREVDRADGEFF